MEVDCYLKMVQWMVTPTNDVIAQPGFVLRGALGTLEIFTTLSAEYKRISKTVSPSERGAPGTVSYYNNDLKF